MEVSFKGTYQLNGVRIINGEFICSDAEEHISFYVLN